MADQITRTNIRLMSGVPFNVDYKHTRWFDTPAQQQAYMSAKPVVYSTGMANFQRIEGRYYFKCPEHIEHLEDVNYIRFNNRNADGTTNSKVYYGFVTHLEYMNKGNTHVYFELDVVQTFMFDMDFNESYVVREHMDRYRSDAVPRVNTIDEGLDHGQELDIKKYYPVQNPHGLRYFVIVAKEPLHDTGGDETENASYVISPQPLSYYFVPFGPDGLNGTILHGQDDFSTTPPDRIMSILAGSEEAVNHVVSYYITDSIGIPPKDVRMSDGGSSIILEYTTLPGSVDLRVVNIGSGDNIQVVYVKKCTEFEAEEFTVAQNYWLEFDQSVPMESKTLMSPYRWIELHDYRGGVVRYRPEYISGSKLTIVRRGSLGLSNKVTYSVKGYNQSSSVSSYDPHTEHEFALYDTNPNDVSVKNEYLAAFLQGNRNQIQNQQNSAIVNGAFNALGSMISVRGAQQVMNQTGEQLSTLSGMQGLANTALTIQGIQAKQDDAGNMPPSISKMGNNTAYDFGHGLTGCYVVYKGIKSEYQRTITDFFRAYGYKSNQFKVPNMHTRRHFNYVETVDCVITGDIHNKYLTQLKEVFNKGITLWHTDAIGNYALSNQEVE